MTTYTILHNSDKKNRSDVIIEFAVPGSNNAAARPWQTVAAETRDSTGTMNPTKRNDTAHIAKLDAGKIVEIPLTVDYNAKLTPAKKLVIIEAAVTAKVTEFTAEFASLYEFYGITRII